MATSASCSLAIAAAGAANTSQPTRNHGTARPVASATFVNSELFSSKAGLSARVAGASFHVKSRHTSPLTICKISKGDIVPPVGLKDEEGKLVNLDKFRGKPLVLYFYPADESPACTRQACSFRDSYEKFKKAGAEVVGVSGDTPESHKVSLLRYHLKIYIRLI
uniref:thioredoxin-dependent peroxiredoxin n=1 Tax=Physcomitrium patens TaxID=3218 RepID=A0A7I4A5I4_PHYPA